MTPSRHAFSRRAENGQNNHTLYGKNPESEKRQKEQAKPKTS